MVTRGDVSSRETLEQIHHNDESAGEEGFCGGSETGISIAMPIYGGSQIVCIQLHSDERIKWTRMIFVEGRKRDNRKT